MKICEIVNSRFCWFLRVDGESISFQGSCNADYFANHYTNLGYKVERIDQHND